MFLNLNLIMIIYLISSILFSIFFNFYSSFYLSLNYVNESLPYSYSEFFYILNFYLVFISGLSISLIFNYRFSFKKISFNGLNNFFYIRNITFKTLVLFSIYLFLFFFIYKDSFWIRDGYFDHKHVSATFLSFNLNFIYMFLKLFTIGLIILLGLYYKKNSFLSICLFIIIIIINISLASRIIQLYFITFIVIIYLQNKSSATLFFNFLISLFVTANIMYLREYPLHGFHNYLNILFSFNYPYFENFYRYIYYITSFSFYLSGLVLFNYEFNMVNFLVSIDPKFSFMNSWNYVSEELRFFNWMPFNGLGHLYTGGYQLVFIFSLLVGFLFNFIHHNLIKHQNILNIFIYFMGIYLIFLLNQYNLRSSCRIIYYIIILYSFMNIYKIVKNKIISR